MVRMDYETRKKLLACLSTLVVIGLVDMDGFVSVLSRIEDAELEIDEVSDGLMSLIYRWLSID